MFYNYKCSFVLNCLLGHSVENHLGIIAACAPTIRPLFTSRDRRPKPAQPPVGGDTHPLRRAAIKHINSISDALRSIDDNPNGTRHIYHHKCSGLATPGDKNDGLLKGAGNGASELVLEDLDVRRTRSVVARDYDDLERRVSDQV